jgi:hypothetical protein
VEKTNAAPMYENMRLKAKESGMNFNLDEIKKTPNTCSFSFTYYFK